MEKYKLKDIISFLVRLVLAYIFIDAAYGKIINPHQFAGEIANYNIMMDESINMMALFLPWIELIVGIYLILGLRLKASAAISFGMMFMFIAAISIAMLQGLDINCGCHAETATPVGWAKLAEDFVYLIMCTYLYLVPSKFLSVELLFNRKKEGVLE